MIEKRKWLLPLLAAVCLLCGACAQRDIQQDQDLIDLQVNQPETVYIGAVLPLSGENEELGQELQAAMDLAVDIVNNSHDLDWDIAKNNGLVHYGNAQLQLVYEDDGSNEIQAADSADKALNLGVVAMVGAGQSDSTASVAKRCRLADVALVSGASNSPALTDGVTYTFGRWFNRVAPDPYMECALYFAYIKHLNQTQNANIKTVAVAYTDTVSCLRALDVFNECAAEAGLEVLVSVGYNANTGSVTTETSRIVTAGADVVVHIGGQDELALFAAGYKGAQYAPKLMICYYGGYENESLIRAVRDEGLDNVIGVSVLPELRPVAAPTPDEEEDDGTTTVTLNTPTDENKVQVLPLARDDDAYNEIFAYIDQLYRQRTGKDMTSDALLEFASVIALAQAVDTAGTTEVETLQSTLKETVFDAPYLTSGSIDFDELGQNTVMCGYLTTIDEDGRFVPIF